MLLGDVMESLELPCNHPVNSSLQVNYFAFPGISTYTTSTNVPNLATLDDIVQSSHDSLSWDIVVQYVDLQNVDVCSKSRNASVNSVENMFPAQANLVYHVPIVGAGCGNGWLAPVSVDAEIILD